MKSLFDHGSVAEIFQRLDKLGPNSASGWGKMDVAQMQAHCSAVLDIASGRTKPDREFLGLLIGRFVKHTYYNDKPWGQGLPTNVTALVADHRDFELEGHKLRNQIEIFQQNGPEKCTTHPHPFLGNLTSEQWGKAMYKHLDHHLRQFNV